MADFLNGVKMDHDALLGLRDTLDTNLTVLGILLLKSDTPLHVVRNQLDMIATVGRHICLQSDATADRLRVQNNRRSRVAA